MPGIPSKDASFVRETPRNYALTLYINSLLEQGVNAEIDESDASILLGLSDTVKQLTDWYSK